MAAMSAPAAPVDLLDGSYYGAVLRHNPPTTPTGVVSETDLSHWTNIGNSILFRWQ